MNEMERIALEKSIKKWANIRDRKGVDERVKNCPLCERHERDICNGCVIDENGYYGCNYTPYNDWWEHHVKYHGMKEFSNEPMYNECDECTRIAEEEVKFLKSLRPAP